MVDEDCGDLILGAFLQFAFLALVHDADLGAFALLFTGVGH